MGKPTWPGTAQGAVSVTYDDALPCHLNLVAPMWEAHGLSVTFYTPIRSMVANLSGWRDVASAGHELGNHSVFHPCRKKPGADWPADEYDLSSYTARRWRDEMELANGILSSLDGRTSRSFGNTCSDTEIGDGEDALSLDLLIEELFVAGRGPFTDEPVDPAAPHFPALGHYGGDNRDFGRLRKEIDSAMDAGKWIIYMIHGVGEGTHGLFIDPAVHTSLVDYLAGSQDTIWTAPVSTVATFLRSSQQATAEVLLD